MHRRSLLASEKKTVSAVSSTASAERPILSPSKGQTALNSRNSAAPAFITRSNNPYSASSNNKQENSKQENSKQEISKPKTTRRSRSRGKQKETSDSSSTETSGTFFPF